MMNHVMMAVVDDVMMAVVFRMGMAMMLDVGRAMVLDVRVDKAMNGQAAACDAHTPRSFPPSPTFAASPAWITEALSRDLLVLDVAAARGEQHWR